MFLWYNSFVYIEHWRGENVMATILCAGGAGYIGTHTCIALLQAGHKVIVADDLSNSKKDFTNHTNCCSFWCRDSISISITIKNIGASSIGYIPDILAGYGMAMSVST